MFLTRFIMPCALIALSSFPLKSQELADFWQPQDCLALTIAERERLEALGQSANRSQIGKFLSSCMAANATAELDFLKQKLARYNVELQRINLRINEKGQLIDAKNQVVGILKRQNSEIRLEIQASNARQLVMLRKAERILRDLAEQ